MPGSTSTALMRKPFLDQKSGRSTNRIGSHVRAVARDALEHSFNVRLCCSAAKKPSCIRSYVRTQISTCVQQIPSPSEQTRRSRRMPPSSQVQPATWCWLADTLCRSRSIGFNGDVAVASLRRDRRVATKHWCKVAAVGNKSLTFTGNALFCWSPQVTLGPAANRLSINED